MKGEGVNRISILNLLRYKDFSKRNLPHLFSNKTSKYTFTQKLLHTFPIKPLQTLPIKRKWANRMPSRFSRFSKFAKCLRKGTIEPRQGHLCARVRAQRCPRKAQWCTSQTPPENPKHRFLSFRDMRRKQVICTSATNDINFLESKSKEHPYTPFISLHL